MRILFEVYESFLHCNIDEKFRNLTQKYKFWIKLVLFLTTDLPTREVCSGFQFLVDINKMKKIFTTGYMELQKKKIQQILSN